MEKRVNKYATQGRLLIEQLKQRPHTYLEMLDYSLSTSPWKRIAECLRENEAIVKGRDRKGRTTWAVRIRRGV